jgi:hypothetical protein
VSKYFLSPTYMIRLSILSLMVSGFLFSCGQKPAESQIVERTPIDSTYYFNRGDMLTKAAFDSLSKTLQNAIRESGPAEAIAFCNIHALPITEAALTDEAFALKRTSLNLRNPKNKPTAFERDILEAYSQSFARGEKLESRLVVREDTVHFAKPIMLMPLCTACHGDKQNLAPQVLSKIEALYPADEATGFSPGDLRGMWHVKFKARAF